MAKKWGIDFDGVDQYLQKLKSFEGAAEKAAENALIETQRIVADKAEQAMQSHNDTGKTSNQIIRDGDVIWTGSTAEISVGFKISDGGGLPGLPSIFLMYGTTVYGQPNIAPDANLYNAVYGKEVKKEAREAQKAAFDAVVKEVMG